LKEENMWLIRNAWELHDEVNSEFEEDDGREGLIESAASLAINIEKAFSEYDEQNKQLKVYEARYKELEERYLHANEKHFGEILTLYFEDEPYPSKEGNCSSQEKLE